MPADFVHLIAELHLRIVEFVLSTPNEPPCEDETPSGHRDVEMRSTEPPVPKYLKALISLSQTCRTLYTVVAPHIYRKLYLTNTTTSAASLQAVAAGPFHDLVAEVLFVGRVPELREEGSHDIAKVFPEELDCVLSQRTELFSSLKSLNIGFSYHSSDRTKWLNGFTHKGFDEADTKEEMLSSEQKGTHQAFIAKVCTAIAHNWEVHQLKMRCLNPKMVSAYNSGSFRRFLGHVQSFQMSLWGDHLLGSDINHANGYVDGLRKLDRILSQLSSCTSFTLEPSRSGWRPPFYPAPTPIALSWDQIPMLRRLNLSRCSITSELDGFMTAHRPDLEEVVLQYCASTLPSSHTSIVAGIDWHVLFASMLCMKNLRKFDVFPVLEIETQGPGFHVEQDEKPRAEYSRSFVYGEYSRFCAHFSENKVMMNEKMEEGRDTAAWNALVAMIRTRQDA